jgi:hypothetical protein
MIIKVNNSTDLIVIINIIHGPKCKIIGMKL